MSLRRLGGDAGQSLVEYALILLLVGLVALGALRLVGGDVRDAFNDVATALNPAHERNGNNGNGNGNGGPSGNNPGNGTGPSGSNPGGGNGQGNSGNGNGNGGPSGNNPGNSVGGGKPK